MTDTPYTSTPFNVTVTPVDEKRCRTEQTECKFRLLEFGEVWCNYYCKECNDERLPECLAAEQKAAKLKRRIQTAMKAQARDIKRAAKEQQP